MKAVFGKLKNIGDFKANGFLAHSDSVLRLMGAVMGLSDPSIASFDVEYN